MSTAAREPIAGHEHAFEPGTDGWTLLLLHGTGGDEQDLLQLGRQLAPHAALLSPRGTVLEGGTTTRFFARHGANDIDVPDLLTRTDMLVEFIRGATAQYALDPARILALGYSNGANIALNTMLVHPGVLRGGALLRPVLYHEPDPLPSLDGTSVLLAVGARDPYTPPAVVERLVSVLEQARADVELHVDPAAGHGLTTTDLQQAASFLGKLLP